MRRLDDFGFKVPLRSEKRNGAAGRGTDSEMKAKLYDAGGKYIQDTVIHEGEPPPTLTLPSSTLPSPQGDRFPRTMVEFHLAATEGDIAIYFQVEHTK